MNHSGAIAIAQDAAGSFVHGMPGWAISLDSGNLSPAVEELRHLAGWCAGHGG